MRNRRLCEKLIKLLGKHPASSSRFSSHETNNTFVATNIIWMCSEMLGVSYNMVCKLFDEVIPRIAYGISLPFGFPFRADKII